MASIGPGSMVSIASYNNLAITQIVKMNRASTPGIWPIPNTATKIAANNKSGIVRTMFKINRAGMVIHFVRIILLAQINAIGTETIAPKNVPTIAMRIVSNIGCQIAFK